MIYVVITKLFKSFKNSDGKKNRFFLDSECNEEFIDNKQVVFSPVKHKECEKCLNFYENSTKRLVGIRTNIGLYLNLF